MNPSRSAQTIGVVVPSLHGGGGVVSVARFIVDLLEDCDRYDPHIVSLAMSASDAHSVRLLSPKTWLRGIEIREKSWEGRRYTHVGANLAELEFQRFRPREQLSGVLNQFDLVQVVAGIPAWAYVTRDVGGPVALQVATFAYRERPARLARESGMIGAWRHIASKITEHFDERGLRCSDAILVENELMLSEVRDRGYSERVTLAPPGIDTEVFHPKPFSEREDYLLAVGRLTDPRKNLRLLLEAYLKLRHRLQYCPRLVLAGSDPIDRNHIDFAKRHGLWDKIDVFKDVTQERLAALYRNAGLFVLSSDEEGLGMVILEAMASGLPVVSTDCVGPRTSVVPKKTGYLTQVGDAEQLAESVAFLLENPAIRRRMGDHARDRAVHHFSIRSAGARYLKTYDRLLAQPLNAGGYHSVVESG